MHFKRILFLFFCFFNFIFISNRVGAIDIQYCNYGENLELMMPVTIGVEINGIHKFYPFERMYDISYDDSLFVYNEATCKTVLNDGSNYENDYLINLSYYYSYNGEKTPVSYIGGGEYSKLDKTSPNIYSPQDVVIANVDTYIELDKISDYIISTDETDGRIIPEIVYDNYSENYNVIGEYSILFRACDKANNCSSYNQRINVIDNTKPNITGNDYLKTYMSNPMTLIDISKTLTGIDNYDGDISHKIVLDSSNYNFDRPGTYYAYFSIIDSSSNKIASPFKLTIEVEDDIAPTIEGPTIFTSKLSSILELNTILSNMIIVDNIDLDAYKNIYIISDDYSNNKEKIGTYNIVIGAYDNKGNEAIPYKIEINVIDDLAPTIDGKSLYDTYLSSPLSLLEIKSNIIVYDNYDGNLVNKLEIIDDTYSVNKDKIGIFYISFLVVDSSQNESEPFIIEIHVYDDISPIIEGTNFYSSITSQKLDPLSIKLSLKASDNIDGDISDLIVLNEDTYTNNENLTGTYFLTFYVIDKSGNISPMFKVKIIVKEEFDFLKAIDNSYVYLNTNESINDSQILEILSIDKTNYNSITTLENTYINNYNIQGDYKIVYQIENTDYTKETITINIITKQEPQTYIEESHQTSQEKKETIFSKIISFFTNIFSNIGSFFKNLFS